MKLYHRTSSEAAEAILASGFRDATGKYMTSSEHTGVWVANRPLDANEGADGDALLELTIDEALIADYEWVQEPSFGYREWLVPAAVLNTSASTRSVDEDEL